MYFHYVTIAGRRGPFVPVLLQGRHAVFGLIDSGADALILPRSIADLLGISYERSTSLRGVGGIQEAFVSSVSLSVAGMSHRSVRVPCFVVDHDLPILIGRAGFFDEFDIVFNQRNGVFAVTPAI